MACLDANQAQDFVAGRLDGSAHAATEAHLDRCSQCRQLVAVLAPDVASAATVPEAPGRDVVAPRRVSRYELGARLGEGGMGVVYAAYDPELHRDIAIKLLRAHGAAGDTLPARARLLREAQAMARVSHPNVLAVYDVGTWEDSVFIAVEIAAGGTLRAWQRGRSWRDIVAAYREAGRGLAAAHAAGLIHRDFKPDNVVLGGDGRPRVTDFGLARTAGEASEPGASISGALAAALTQTGAVMGTPAYMAPEQIDGGEVDARTDQFAFCVALWEALYRARPFTGHSLAELRQAIADPPAPPADPGGVPPRIHRALVRGLAEAPGARWPSMAALCDALAPPRSRAALLAGGGLVAAAAIALAVLRPWHAADDPCPRDPAELAGVWDDAVKQQLRGELVARGLAPQWAAIASALDGYSARWLDRSVAACRDVRVDHHHGEPALALEQRCLHRALDGVRATVKALSSPDVASASPKELASTLPSLDPCADLDALAEDRVRPPTPAQQARLVDAQVMIARAQLAAMQQHYDLARSSADDALAAARKIGYPPFLATAQIQRGMLLVGLWRMNATPHALDDAIAALLEAADLADGASDDNQRVTALGELSEAYGENHDAALATLARRLAVSASRRPNASHETRAQGDEWEAEDLAARDPERALADLREAVQLRGEFHNKHVDDIKLEATILGATGRRDQAKTMFAADAAALEAHAKQDYDHVIAAGELMSLGVFLSSLDDHDGAIAAYRRAAAICDRYLEQAGTLFTGSAHMMLGSALSASDDQGANAEFRRALALLAGSPVLLGQTYFWMAAEARRHDRGLEAMYDLERAIALHGGDPGAFENLAGLFSLEVGQPAAARRYLAIAIDAFARLAHDHPSDSADRDLAVARSRMGWAMIDDHDEVEGVALLERVLPDVERLARDSPNQVGAAKFALARGIAARDPARARTLAHAARLAVAATVDPAPPTTRLLADIDRWLAAHP